MGKTCCFTGHRPRLLGYPENSENCKVLKIKLEKAIIDLYERHNVTHFISGMALGVDTYAAEIVLKLKEKYSITLECARPCETQTLKWTEEEKKRYKAILEKCDKDTLLQKEFTPDCMDKRNKYMVDNSDFVIAVWNGKPGGTKNTVKYAEEKKKEMVMIEP